MRTDKSRRFSRWIAATVFGGAAACSAAPPDAQPSNEDTGIQLFELKSDLPSCNASRQAEVYYCKGEAQLYYCDGKKMQELSLPGGSDAPLLAVTLPAVVNDCAHGGSTIKLGRDTNRNGKLEASEVSTSTSVCTGAAGPAGEDGGSCHVRENGDGTKTLSCDDGTEVVIRDGRSGNDGETGADGTPGASGEPCAVVDEGDGTKTITCPGGGTVTVSDGKDGADGDDADAAPPLLRVTDEPVGANCPTGGHHVEIGSDRDGNGVLEPGEVTSDDYVCNPPLECEEGTFDLDGQATTGCEFTLDPVSIFVSAEAGAKDDATCGLGPLNTGVGSHPCRSIGFGLTRAAQESRGTVRVANAQYDEAVTMANGIRLLGGYAPVSWLRDVAVTQTVIRGSSALGIHEAAVIARSITLPTLLQGFRIEGPRPQSFGANSYAVYVLDSSSALELTGNQIVGGDGADAMAASSASPGSDGGDGVEGASAFITAGPGQCGSSPRLGGSSGRNDRCAGTNGGSGGGNACSPLVGQIASATPGSPSSSAGSSGRDQQLGASNCSVNGAINGTDGSSGTNGLTASAPLGCSSTQGSISNGHWLALEGVIGQPGQAGRGGGGGGAGGGALCSGCLEGRDRLGASGGGGGAGGCGGLGGQAGSGGGGSFGIFVVRGSSPPNLHQNVITRGRGGKGAAGGRGGQGGSGGLGAAGGVGLLCAGAAGRGGDGGSGGPGSGGGGACGGNSFGVFTASFSGAATDHCASSLGNVIAGGSAGSGGLGGISLGNAGGDGATGSLGACGNG